MWKKLDPLVKHKRTILKAIRQEEAKKLAREGWNSPAPRKRRHYRRRYRFDTYNVGEVSNGQRV